jgi:hypothetical protein
MARKLFVLALFLLAGSVGVLGFQALYLWRIGSWPSVPVAFVWDSLLGTSSVGQWLPFHQAGRWLGGLPVTAAGIVLAYLVFLASDTLRRR